jgi:hypothetical protein
MASPRKPRKRKAAPKPPSKPRVAVYFPPIHDGGAMGTLGNKLVAAAEANTGDIVNPTYIPPLKLAVAAQATAVVAAEGGPDAAQTALFAASGKVHDVIVQHASWVQATANQKAPADAVSFITLCGFQVAKRPQRRVVTSPTVTNGDPTVVQLEFPNVAGAVMWFAELSLDGGKTYVRSTDTENRKAAITGLPSGQNVSIRVRAYVRGSGYTQWTTLTIVVT